MHHTIVIVKEVPVRRISALIGAAALLTAALAGCTFSGADGGCATGYDAGDASSAVSATGAVAVSGEAGKAPKVTFPTPLIARDPQVSVLDAGSGEPIVPGSNVDYEYSVFFGATGEQLAATGYGATDSQPNRSIANLSDSIGGALKCAQVGDRLALVTPASDAFGAGTLQGNGIDDDDTLILVIDIVASYLGKADGVNQLPQDGMPTVVTAVDGTPGISVALVEEPTATRIATIKAGGGATVAEGDTAILHYSAWYWPAAIGDEPESLQSTWDADPPKAATASVASIADGGGLPAGVVSALTGAKVGSQLLVVIPPGDDGFGTDVQGVDATRTTIWVIDLLGVRK